MVIQPSETLVVIWPAWFLSWMAASFWSGHTEKSATTRETWIYRTAIFTGAVMMTPWAAQLLGVKPVWKVGTAGAYALIVVTLLGLSLTWLARIHLGHLWSSAITRKEQHRLIDTGPYAFVRHPIYTGLITALLATAVTEATFVALIGALFITSGLLLKARAEERFLMAELGPNDYESYIRRVPMLIPFLWH